MSMAYKELARQILHELGEEYSDIAQQTYLLGLKVEERGGPEYLPEYNLGELRYQIAKKLSDLEPEAGKSPFTVDLGIGLNELGKRLQGTTPTNVLNFKSENTFVIPVRSSPQDPTVKTEIVIIKPRVLSPWTKMIKALERASLSTIQEVINTPKTDLQNMSPETMTFVKTFLARPLPMRR